MFKKTVIILMTLVLFAGLFAGCSKEEAQPEVTEAPEMTTEVPEEPTVLKYGISMVHLENLDVHYTTQAEPYEAAMQTHEPMIGKNADGSLYPLLLTEMPTVSEDGLEYTFTLKEGITFHDGSILTSEDVAATMKRILAPETVSVNASVFSGLIEGAQDYFEGTADDISGITIIDDQIFEIKLTAPNVSFLNTLSTYAAVIYPKTAVETEGWGTEVYIGTGPFMVKEFEPGVKLVLENYEGYHGGAKELDAIEFLNMDQNTALLEFEAGNINITKITDTALIKSYNEDEQFADNIIKTPSNMTVAMSFNMNIEPFNDAKVREAISIAINREEIADKLMGGTAVPAYSFLPEGILGHDASEEPIAYEPEKAKELLAEAGYPDGIEIQAITTDTSSNTYILQYLEQSFKECGITMEIQVLDAASFGDLRAQGQVPIFLLTWASDAGDPGDMLSVYSTPMSQYISSFYMSEEFDADLAEGLTIQDIDERADHYKAMDTTLTKVDFACAPIVHPSTFVMVSDNVENLELGNVFRLFDATLK